MFAYGECCVVDVDSFLIAVAKLSAAGKIESGKLLAQLLFMLISRRFV